MLHLERCMETAGNLMTRNPASLPASATIADALSTLIELDVRHLPVVNAEREVVGMVSDRDLRGEPAGTWASPRRQLDLHLSEIMSSDVLSVGIDTPLDEIVALMLEYKIGAVPVTDAEGALVGIVSYIDVLRSLQRSLGSGA